jgi:hypothetical protein
MAVDRIRAQSYMHGDFHTTTKLRKVLVYFQSSSGLERTNVGTRERPGPKWPLRVSNRSKPQTTPAVHAREVDLPRSPPVTFYLRARARNVAPSHGSEFLLTDD